MNRFGKAKPFRFEIPKSSALLKSSIKTPSACVDFFIKANKTYTTRYDSGEILYPGSNRSLCELTWFGRNYGFSDEDILRTLLKRKVDVFFCPDIKRVVFLETGCTAYVYNETPHFDYLDSLY